MEKLNSTRVPSYLRCLLRVCVLDESLTVIKWMQLIRKKVFYTNAIMKM
jgi:hypothetical protein